jgi:TrmH family RNA methyltransferase
VPRSIIEKISDTKTPQEVVAVVKMEQVENALTDGRYIYCDNLQDPGNVGTIIRTADAFSFDGVILSEGCADVYSPKVIRSTQGSLFNIRIIRNKNAEFLKGVKNVFMITSTALYGQSVKVKEMTIKKNHIFVVGNEGSGVSKEILDISDEIAYIPMSGKAESLNVSIAASIVMYEVKNRE